MEEGLIKPIMCLPWWHYGNKSIQTVSTLVLEILMFNNNNKEFKHVLNSKHVCHPINFKKIMQIF